MNFASSAFTVVVTTTVPPGVYAPRLTGSAPAAEPCSNFVYSVFGVRPRSTVFAVIVIVWGPPPVTPKVVSLAWLQFCYHITMVYLFTFQMAWIPKCYVPLDELDDAAPASKKRA